MKTISDFFFLKLAFDEASKEFESFFFFFLFLKAK